MPAPEHALGTSSVPHARFHHHRLNSAAKPFLRPAHHSDILKYGYLDGRFQPSPRSVILSPCSLRSATQTPISNNNATRAALLKGIMEARSLADLRRLHRDNGPSMGQAHLVAAIMQVGPTAHHMCENSHTYPFLCSCPLWPTAAVIWDPTPWTWPSNCCSQSGPFFPLSRPGS